MELVCRLSILHFELLSASVTRNYVQDVNYGIT